MTMSIYKTLAAVGLLAATFAAACDDQGDELSNPHYATGGKRSSIGGETSSTAGNAAGGMANAGQPTASQGGAGLGGANAPAGAAGTAGEDGQGSPPQPPYDCVLEPKTHLDIINACTDATRIEKHPDLPAIP